MVLAKSGWVKRIRSPSTPMTSAPISSSSAAAASVPKSAAINPVVASDASAAQSAAVAAGSDSLDNLAWRSTPSSFGTGNGRPGSR